MIATVVRVQRPTSVQPGNVALVRGDGTIEGFIGGVCAEHSVRVYALKAIETGRPLLLRMLPDAPGDGGSSGTDDPPVPNEVVVVAGDTPSLIRAGEMVYFCCTGCMLKYEERHGEAARAV